MLLQLFVQHSNEHSSFHLISHLAKENGCSIFAPQLHVSVKSFCQMVIKDLFLFFSFFSRRDQNVPFQKAKMEFSTTRYHYTTTSILKLQNWSLSWLALQTKLAGVVAEALLATHTNFPVTWRDWKGELSVDGSFVILTKQPSSAFCIRPADACIGHAALGLQKHWTCE